MSSNFANLPKDLKYWQKQDHVALFQNLDWNFPEQKTDTIAVIGGNSQNFRVPVRLSEYLTKFPFKNITSILPDALRPKFPDHLPNLIFTPSTESGSFAESPLFEDSAASADFAIFAGDLTKNSITAITVSKALTKILSPDSNSHGAIITRDAVDLLTPEIGSFLNSEQLFIIASMSQLQKIFRSVYYPKMIMLSQPLLPTIETLHKFTLSYATTILTFHEGQIIVASHGQISTTPIMNTTYNPISIWNGELVAKVACFNLWNPGRPFESATSAILYV